jgi:hypothetical protein
MQSIKTVKTPIHLTINLTHHRLSSPSGDRGVPFTEGYMFKNYITVAIRNLARHKTYTFINVAGLAIGLACSTLILLYLQHEFSYDRHHSKADRIYKVIRQSHPPEGTTTYSSATLGPLGPALAEEYPEVERATRFLQREGVWVNHNNNTAIKGNISVVDPTLSRPKPKKFDKCVEPLIQIISRF